MFSNWFPADCFNVMPESPLFFSQLDATKSEKFKDRENAYFEGEKNLHNRLKSDYFL